MNSENDNPLMGMGERAGELFFKNEAGEGRIFYKYDCGINFIF